MPRIMIEIPEHEVPVVHLRAAKLRILRLLAEAGGELPVQDLRQRIGRWARGAGNLARLRLALGDQIEERTERRGLRGRETTIWMLAL